MAHRAPKRHILDFEQPIVALEDKIAELKQLAIVQNVPADDEVKKLTEKADKLRTEVFSKLTAWEQVQLARHPLRPYTLDYVGAFASEFVELHGDRTFADDPAIVGGFMTINDLKVMMIGQQKGRDTRENIRRNFGMPNPEGYRKAHRLMRMAAKFKLPIVTMIDTPGAYPGLGAEERGQAQAIAENLKLMASLPVPIVCVVIGEGGSGGALALGVADRILMLQHAVYSVITPEGCAAILWKDQSKVKEAADALKLTAKHLMDLGIIDRIIPEPPGGAHRDPAVTAEALGRALYEEVKYLQHQNTRSLLERRLQKYMNMGYFEQESP
ncbi:MAG TPA: acetyl-CoA carboxylase carboxyltransferase subunit alpha [Candidatus Krumholzibacteria bacterium]|nr:acetyl-CoA carboxylase carboxyltransferase subunit alpha [Candidatus Krumholzibacteria bacterium]